jgi:serine phosphatase RsbU (regulator of sigma subunit)
MARIRFTLRAYLIEGHPPDVALTMCARQSDISRDGHFATALVGVVDLASSEVIMANAGHLNPLIILDGQANFASTSVGVPLGVSTAASYSTTRIVLEPGSTLVAYTDGLVERRGEDLEGALQRLASTASLPRKKLDDVVSALLLAADGVEDDIAILAFRLLPLQALATDHAPTMAPAVLTED